MISNFRSFDECRSTHLSTNFTSHDGITTIIEALENFEDSDLNIRAAAIALRATELGINQMHFYAIAFHAGLGVAQ
jgi:HKD family nuclease